MNTAMLRKIAQHVMQWLGLRYDTRSQMSACGLHLPSAGMLTMKRR